MPMTLPNIPKLKFKDSGNFLLIAGPCVIENETMPFEIAEKIVAVCEKYSVPFIYKASYKKANRSRLDSFTGIGDEQAMNILREVGIRFNIPVLTDVHTEMECLLAASYVDV